MPIAIRPESAKRRGERALAEDCDPVFRRRLLLNVRHPGEAPPHRITSSVEKYQRYPVEKYQRHLEKDIFVKSKRSPLQNQTFYDQ